MKSARVLIVEDEEVPRFMLQRYLEGKGHVVAAVRSAEDAIPRLELGEFDLVLLDLLLPGLSGFEALAYFRRSCRAPIHIMSGQTDEVSRGDAAALGAAGFVPKPVDFPEVCALLDALPEKP